MTRLYKAAEQGNLMLVKKYLKEGDNPNELNSNRQNALHAITLGNPISHQTNPETRIEIVKELLDYWIEINEQDEEGRTPLYYAAYMHDHNMVDFLLKNGAHTNIKDCLGDTPLHVATQLRIAGEVDYSITIEMLLREGANIDSRNNIGLTPRTELLFSGRNELQYLIEKYSDEKVPELSKNEQGLAKILIQFSDLLSIDKNNKKMFQSIIPNSKLSSSDSDNDSMPELEYSDDEGSFLKIQ